LTIPRHPMYTFNAWMQKRVDAYRRRDIASMHRSMLLPSLEARPGIGSDVAGLIASFVDVRINANNVMTQHRADGIALRATVAQVRRDEDQALEDAVVAEEQASARRVALLRANLMRKRKAEDDANEETKRRK
jgi:hypothetical protein